MDSPAILSKNLKATHMSFVDDIDAFLNKYGFTQETFDNEKLWFRLGLLAEELAETEQAAAESDPEEIVDGLIDLIYIAIGTLRLAGVDVQKAWSEVHRANMSKIRGVKPGREQSGGFDVYKPANWVGPSHCENHGLLKEIYVNS